MLTQSKETRDAWRASQRTLDIKVTIDGKTYGATDINSLKYDSGAYNGDTFAIGSTYSNTVQIEFSHLIEGLKLGMEVRPSIGIKTSSGYVYEPLGVFIISSEIKMDRNNNLTTVSASDRFCCLEGAYTSKLTYPAKVLDVIAEICAQSGVKANTDDLARLPHQADLPAPITGQSYRKALGWIAQLYVGYALFDRQGLFTIRTISEPNYELDPSQYEQAGLTKNEAAYKINGIQCQVTFTTKTRDGESTEETKTYQAGDATGSQIKLENNIMTPQRLNDIWEQLKDLTFYPFSLNWFGNPAVEAGDWLQLEDKQGNSFVVPNSSYTLDFNGGLSATSKADQTTSSDQMVPWQGSVAQTIKELRLRRVPDGTVVFPPSVTAPPTNAKFNDVWFKKNGNSTELWIFEKQDDGSGKWIRKDLSDDEIKKKVTEAQQGLNQAKADIINNKQKADADIENLNKSIETNKKVADESLQKLNDSVTNLQGQYDNNVIPNLNKVMADASDALQKYISAQNSIADLTKQAQQQGKDIADVSNTVKGLNINYANLAGDVNSTKVDVKGLQTTVGTANGDIAQLKLDAQNLQTMLAGKVDNTTYTNFVNLTNQALNARLTASDLNGYAKTVDVQATANGLRVDLNSVTDRMNNLKVGTSNLLHHSDTFDGWIKGYSVTVTADKYLDGRIAILGGAGVDGGQLTTYLDGPYNDDLVTWVVYAKADNAGDKMHTELWGGGGYTDQSLTTKWQAYKFSGHRNINHHDFYLWGCVGNKGNIYVALPFAVVGNTIGTWGPNASDINHDLNKLSAQITTTSQQFSSYYTKSEADNRTNSAKNDAVNAIKSDSNWQGLSNILINSGFLQTADGFLQKVQQTTIPMFNGGGVNLVKDTSESEISGKAYDIKDYYFSEPLEPNTKYTISIDAKVDQEALNHQQFIFVDPYTANWSWGAQMSCISASLEYQHYRYTFITPDASQKVTNISVYLAHPDGATNGDRDNLSGTGYFKKLKVERGEIDTPYSHAPSDNASQIAFSELSQSLEGLRSTVGSNYGSLQSQISQSSSSIRTELTDKIKGIDNKTTSTANSLNSVIGRVGSLENLTNIRVVNNAINANDYTNTGNYFIQSTYNINVPGTNWCYLKVEKVNDGRIVQTWQADSDPTLRYARTKFGDSWTQWQRSASYSEYSELNRTVQGLQSTVSSNRSDLQSQISQTAKNIRQEVSDKTNGLQTQINQQANNFNVSLNSLRKETAWQKVTSAIDANNYKTTGNYWIQATPNSNTPDSSAWAYLQVVASPDAKRIKQTWQRDNNENEIYTRLLIEDNWTSWQRTVTGGNIMAQINMSAGTTLIQNDKIYMDASSTIFSGNAFIPSAAITSLNADKITAGTINGAKVNVINLNANNITAGTLRGSNGEFYLDSGALHVWQNNHDAWIDQNGIHDYDNQGNNVWISRGSISAYGNSSGAYLFDGGLYLHKSQSLSDAVLDPDYGSITKSDNIVFFGTSGLDIEGKDGFLLRTHGWNDQTLSYLNGNEIIGAGIAGKSDGFINIAAKKQLFLYAGEPIQNNNLKTIPNLVLDGTYQNGQTVLKGTFSQYFFQGPSSGFSGGITLQDEFVNVGSLNGKNYFSINSDGAITITANGKSILSLNGLFPGVNSDFNVRGNFAVTGSKNAIVPTSRGMAAINAYETAEYYFGDIGETQTNSNGVVTVMIDPYFLETVNTLVPYQVFLTSYGDGNVWVSSRSANNFTVKSSNPNIHFAWEIKAKRKGYENDRMKIVKGVFNNEQY
ncbi:peptidase [Limosilactobacillus reuteri]|uniref:peptidase n=1 Tax=Limosilactobacillus reuteri TaxID=1598 RepID=UPI001E4ECC88|nr:peptidase [Limosilactobacillus reuteri]MCC4471816.1 peptidase [Limosilactobacillus reuteri]